MALSLGSFLRLKKGSTRSFWDPGTNGCLSWFTCFSLQHYILPDRLKTICWTYWQCGVGKFLIGVFCIFLPLDSICYILSFKMWIKTPIVYFLSAIILHDDLFLLHLGERMLEGLKWLLSAFKIADRWLQSIWRDNGLFRRVAKKLTLENTVLLKMLNE